MENEVHGIYLGEVNLSLVEAFKSLLNSRGFVDFNINIILLLVLLKFSYKEEKKTKDITNTSIGL